MKPKAKGNKPRHTESELQRSCVKEFRLRYPKYRRLLFAIPNGGKRSKVEAGIMYAEGVLAGAADLQLSIARGGYHGLYLETKLPGTKQTENQILFEQAVTEQGYMYRVYRSHIEFFAIVNEYLNKQ